MTIADSILQTLIANKKPENLPGMQRFGIDTSNALGISLPFLRKLAKNHKKQHELALQLWDSGIHEARILASMVDDPSKVTEQQIYNWSKDFKSWDLCDQVCMNLFAKSPLALQTIHTYSNAESEFEKRVSFVLMACFALKKINASDEVLISFFPILEREACDPRNYVKKAINWALRQIGKKNENLLEASIKCALRILNQNHRSAKWIATDALREFNQKKISNCSDHSER